MVVHVIDRAIRNLLMSYLHYTYIMCIRARIKLTDSAEGCTYMLDLPGTSSSASLTKREGTGFRPCTSLVSISERRRSNTGMAIVRWKYSNGDCAGTFRRCSWRPQNQGRDCSEFTVAHNSSILVNHLP